jgi:hypothetical protein
MKIKTKQLFITTVLLIYVACTVQKKQLYELPEAMLPHVKMEYTTRCDKGQTLYLLTCNTCHNSGTKRKIIIPDWTSAQLSGYTIRVSNRQHEANMPDSLVSEDELGIIMTFLSYKKKNK